VIFPAIFTPMENLLCAQRDALVCHFSSQESPPFLTHAWCTPILPQQVDLLVATRGPKELVLDPQLVTMVCKNSFVASFAPLLTLPENS
jgi:hypothetical protein